ncbi:glycosyltransferase family 2 protein [Candidatus Parcubacteria bacterium]|nr:glycosyltransferase family 2 protein [Candidatus Parcubacteria bacterium]
MNNKTLLSIVLPTYNEKENIKPLLAEVNKIFFDKNYSYEILFIDDSIDETPNIIQKTAKKDNHINLIHRKGKERTGLATAFIKGFKKAKGKYICCLDSDLQHPPKKMIVMLEEAIVENADIVIASRYTKGGSAVGLDGAYRKFISIALRYFVQILFIQTRKTTDPGSGFFLFRKNILKNVKLQPRGFKILIEILMRAKYSKVSQIPYTFLPRKNEESKATMSQGIELLKHLWFIFTTVPEAGRFIKFCIVGGSGVIVNLGFLFVLVEYFDFNKNLAWLISVLLSIASNFILNNIFTYNDRKSSSHNQSIKRIIYYYLISLAVMIFNFAIYKFFMLLGFYYIVSAFIGILFSTFLNFILVTKIVWKKNK